MIPSWTHYSLPEVSDHALTGHKLPLTHTIVKMWGFTYEAPHVSIYESVIDSIQYERSIIHMNNENWADRISNLFHKKEVDSR